MTCTDSRLKEQQYIKRNTKIEESWHDFKNKQRDWQWDEGELANKGYGLQFMINLHNMCGRQVFKYYKETSKNVANIKFRKYLQ